MRSKSSCPPWLRSVCGPEDIALTMSGMTGTPMIDKAIINSVIGVGNASDNQAFLALISSTPLNNISTISA